MLYEDLLAGKERLSVIGLGYVGMPIAVAFAKVLAVIGYDNKAEKIKAYQEGRDPTQEIGDAAIQKSTMLFTSDAAELKKARFHIVAVPTPVNDDHTPNLSPVISASEAVGKNLMPGSIVVYESTVYPGVTEEICIPILERASGLMAGKEFKVGYSPERINPGDKKHRLENIVKIVSGMDAQSLDTIARVYALVAKAGIHRAESIKVAEAAKVIENSQRDINIAFMNELAMVFHRMDIDTGEVIAAMNTKWNALGFRPGLVGGHCIGVDPYYFIYQAQNLGYHSPLISTGRRINDGMSSYIAQTVVRELVRTKVDLAQARLYLMGMTFKENCSDTRNSRAADVYHTLAEYNLNLWAVDPRADGAVFRHEYGFELTPQDEVHDADCIVFLVAHDEFRSLTWSDLHRLFRADGPHLIIDVKGLFSREETEREGFRYWSL